MTLSVTALGAAFLPLGLFVLLFRRKWLLTLLCVAAVLQAPAVAVVHLGKSALGITPFLYVAALALLDLAQRWGGRGALPRMFPEQRTVVGWWFAVFALWIVSALILPWVFQGLRVHSPLDKLGAQASTVALEWSLSNFAQAVQSAVVGLILIWLLLQRGDPGLPRRMAASVVIALAVAAGIGLLQRMAWNGLIPMGQEFWASNPTYAQNFASWAGSVPRVSWPFVEPSYASAWYAGGLGGCLALFLAGRRRHMALASALAAFIALANSMGATGFLALGLVLVLALVVSVAWAIAAPGARGVLAYQWALGTIVSVSLGLAFYLVLRHYGVLAQAGESVSQLLQGRDQTLWGDLRPHADRYALALLADTWGLGVGMGSNRGSSLLVSVAGNTGVLGAVLFLMAFLTQTWLLARRLRSEMDTVALFFLGAGVAVVAAACLSIPDQNWPPMWILLWGGVVALGSGAPEGEAYRESASSDDAVARRPSRRRKFGVWKRVIPW